MKHERLVTMVLAGVLGTALGAGMAGCYVTSFDTGWSNWVVALCALSAFSAAALVPLRHGPLALMALWAGLFWLLWRRTMAPEQLLWLLERVSRLYDGAYDWGVLRFSTSADGAFWPPATLGMALAALGATAATRSKCTATVLLSVVLTLVPCLVVTDTPPAPAAVYPVFAALALLLLTSQVRADSAHQGNRLIFLAALPTALALAGLFLAVPQEGYVNLMEQLRQRAVSWAQGLPGRVSAQLEGLTLTPETGRSLDLEDLGPRRDSDAEVMTVLSDVGGTVYLRGQDYDRYTGLGWSATEHRVEQFTGQGPDMGYLTVRTRTVLDRLYLPYYPGDGRSLVGGRMENTALATDYTIPRRGVPVERQEGDPGDQWSMYRTLPQTAQPLLELAAELTRGQDRPSEKAEAIAAYVRDRAEYDEDTASMPAGREDFAVWFLEEAETGYCVHFATATAALLRAAGIPARYVTGYMVRTQAGQTVSVTGENAHAWAEYYDSDLNVWLVMESTPAQGTAGTGQAQTVPTTEAAPTESAPAEESPEPTAGTTPETVPATTPATTPGATGPASEEAPEESKFPWGILAGALVILAALGAVEGQRRARLALRRAHQHRGGPNAQALARWQETELLARLLGREPPTELEALALKAKFSQHTLEPPELAQFDAWAHSARRTLGRAPWYRRLIYRYIYALEV